jgi:hypothetical protein
MLSVSFPNGGSNISYRTRKIGMHDGCPHEGRWTLWEPLVIEPTTVSAKSRQSGDTPPVVPSAPARHGDHAFILWVGSAASGEGGFVTDASVGFFATSPSAATARRYRSPRAACSAIGDAFDRRFEGRHIAIFKIVASPVGVEPTYVALFYWAAPMALS